MVIFSTNNAPKLPYIYTFNPIYVQNITSLRLYICLSKDGSEKNLAQDPIPVVSGAVLRIHTRIQRDPYGILLAFLDPDPYIVKVLDPDPYTENTDPQH